MTISGLLFNTSLISALLSGKTMCKFNRIGTFVEDVPAYFFDIIDKETSNKVIEIGFCFTEDYRYWGYMGQCVFAHFADEVISSIIFALKRDDVEYCSLAFDDYNNVMMFPSENNVYFTRDELLNYDGKINWTPQPLLSIKQ